MERWKTIEEFNSYSISSDGRVMNNETGRILKPMISTSGYYFVHLVKNRRKYTRYVHRLVGIAFIDNPLDRPQIDHLDGNKLNPAVSNLRWVTESENYMSFGDKSRAQNRKRSVIAVNESGHKITFESRKSAAEYFNCHPAKIKYNHKYQKGNKRGWEFTLS